MTFRFGAATLVILSLGAMGCGSPPPTSTTECLTAPGLTPSQCQALTAMRLPASLPAAIGNAKANDDGAAMLGFDLFFDARLSSNQEVRCATCHLPERVFGDGRASAKGLEPVERNSPSLFTAAWQRWQTWDGKADSLWSQPLLALENPREMNFTRLELAHRVFTSYRGAYEAVFGPLPPLDDTMRFPPRGKPGDAAFDGMSPDDQHAVHVVAANVGKAFEAYLRKAAHRAGRFDRFLDGEMSALSETERAGLVVFFQAKCDACHAGPSLSDDGFHVLCVAAAPGAPAERARAAALEQLAASPFRANGPYHDGPPGEPPPAPTAADEGAYHTPSLRNVARTGPWGHNGTFSTLDAIVDLHLAGGGAGGVGVVDPLLVPVTLDATQKSALLAFLAALDAEDPPPPWNNWPDR